MLADVSGFIPPLPGKWQIRKAPLWDHHYLPWQVVPPGDAYSWSMRAYATGAQAFAAFAGCTTDVPMASYLTWNNLEEKN